jgi:hypothetical protein
MRIDPRFLLAGLAALSLGSGFALAQEHSSSDTTDKLKAAVTPGEFVLNGSDVKTINDSGKLRRYRICAKRESGGATDLKVSSDDRDTTVKVGDCKTVVGRKIQATAATTLSADQHIVGTYHHVTRTAKAEKSESSSESASASR